jgi:hypothetical protein
MTGEILAPGTRSGQAGTHTGQIGTRLGQTGTRQVPSWHRHIYIDTYTTYTYLHPNTPETRAERSKKEAGRSVEDRGIEG